MKHRATEQGFVLPATIILLMVVAVLMTALLVSNRTAGDDVSRRAMSTRVFGVAETGFERYRFAVDSRVANWNNDFRPTLADWQTRIARSGETAVASSDLASIPSFAALNLHTTPTPAHLPPAAAVTLSWPIDLDEAAGGAPELIGWVQPIAILGQGPTRASTTIYLRAWTSSTDRTRVQEPVVYRFTLRPIYFSDFQMLVDGPISILGGATVSATVHSNGYADSYLIERAFVGSERIRAIHPANCNPGARFSTAKGTVTATGSCASVPSRHGTGDIVNLLRTNDSYQQMQTSCAPVDARVRCFTGTTPRSVQLNASSVTVSGPGGGTFSTVPWLALRFPSDVTVSGRISSGSLTIAAGGPGSAFGGSKIVLNGASGPIGSSGSATVGMIAEGDIELSVGGSNCASHVRAALVSTGGALSIPSKYRVWIAPGAPTGASCGALHVEGSIASHYAPLASLQFGPHTVGHHSRHYRYDPALKLRPPPFWPTDDAWSVTGHGTANRDCLTPTTIVERACA